jgi:hypothetical protein
MLKSEAQIPYREKTAMLLQDILSALILHPETETFQAEIISVTYLFSVMSTLLYIGKFQT